MGLEIGFNLHKKVNDKLVNHKLQDDDSTWTCGRCDVTYAWELGCSYDYQTNTSTEAVFNKEFDNYEEEHNDYKVVYKYLPFEDFKTHVMEAVNDTFNDIALSKQNSYKRIQKLENEIATYQNLQLKSETDCVFDKFQEKIEDDKREIEENEEFINSLETDDYDYTHAVKVKQMVEDIEKYLKEGYIVTTFFSFQLITKLYDGDSINANTTYDEEILLQK